MELLIRIFAHELTNQRYSYSFYNAMTTFFNFECSIHKQYFQIPAEELQKLRTVGQEWRQQLKEGDMVDVMVATDPAGRNAGWMQGRIQGVSQDLLQIEFILSPRGYDRKVSRWSTDLAQFESKTAEDYAWRHEFVAKAIPYEFEAEVHDKSSWNKSTIIDFKTENEYPDRRVLMAYCALRVYRDIPNGKRKDNRGTYEGWSDKFDEWVPVFSPRIMPWGSKIGVSKELELEDELDAAIEPDEEFERLYAVPRLGLCVSALYLRLINVFGNLGGFDTIIDVLQHAKEDEVNITVMSCMAQIISLPHPVLHRDFINEKCQQIANVIKQRLVVTSDQALRDVRKEQIDAIIKSVETVSKRIMSKSDRDKQSEILRLELCNKSLISNYLERRIQGIRDLSTVVKNSMTVQNGTFTTEFLIEWMHENNVFNTVWDHRKTHLQIVQRTNEIFKLLVKSSQMDESMLKLFWSLSKADHNLQTEVFKIITECAALLQPTHVEFFFTEITSQSIDKLSLTEFDCLCDLGKQSIEFQPKIRDYFYSIIVNANNFKEDLVDNCISKYAQMIKDQSVDLKRLLFTQFIQSLQSPIITPILRLFTKLIQKQEQQAAQSTSSYPYVSVALPPTAAYSHVTADGKVVTSYSYAQQPQHEVDPQDEPPKQDAVKLLLNELQSELGLVDLLLDNLVAYCKSVRAASIDPSADSRKIFVVSKNCSHFDEINERLQFLKYYASTCDYQFNKVKLRVIYDSLTLHSPVKQDQTEFLTWCKQACQESSGSSMVLDLNEVGEFFSELLQNKSLDVETLPLAGFEFLSNYFISVNASQQNLLKISRPREPQKTWQNLNELNKVQEEPSAQDFVIIVKPTELSNIDLIWMVLLQVNDTIVARKAIDFMIKIYTSPCESLKKEQSSLLQQLLSQLIAQLQDATVAASLIERIVLMIKCLIEETEKKGAQGLQPHSAILKGEMLDRIIIKNNIKPHASNLIVKVFTSATAYEFVDKVSRLLGLAPQFVVVNLKNGNILREQDNGKTLEELGFQNYDIVTVSKQYTSDYGVVPVPLIDPTTNNLNATVYKIFSDWYDLYSNDEGVMTPESATRFILGAINEVVSKEDQRVKHLFTQDANEDGVLDRAEFISWYEAAARAKPETVYENLASHFIRKDLVKLSDVYEKQQFQRLEMPRYTLSHNQSQFDTLFGLLERQDSSSPHVWQLIRMLSTNKHMYDSVLMLDMSKGWKQFFEQGSIQRQIYQNEIIESLMEDSHTSDRVFLVEYSDPHLNKHVKQQKTEQQQDGTIKQTWSAKFIANQGLEYILNEFNNAELTLTGFNLHKLKFMVFILKVCSNHNIDAAQLAVKLMSLVHKIIQLEQHTLEQKQIVYNALSLWTQCQLQKRELIMCEQTGDFVLTGLLKCSEEKIRQEFGATFSTLAKELQPVHSYLLKLLSDNFYQINEYPCRQFFDLFNELIDIHFARQADGIQEEGLLNAEAILSQIIDKIRADQHISSVKPSNCDELTLQQQAEDKESLMIGLVLLTGKIISKVDKELSEKIVREKDIINELFKVFLFASVFAEDHQTQAAPQTMQEIITNKAPRTVKVQSKAKQVNKSREAAYQLLNELIKKSPVILTNFIKDQLWPLLDMIKKPKTWNYTPPASSERVQKYVGLKNLGCICYMNSMMQQFFMIPAFRYNLLCVDDGLSENLQSYKDEQIDDNMVHQLQRLFAHLELSERFDYNPLGFTYSFKEMDGEPTKISEQKDAQEFLTVMFDRLERALAPTSRKYLLQSVFGGKNCSQLICPECGKVSNRVEDLYNLSLTVKDLNSVYDSMQKQIEGEVINDYKCDGCNKKVDITKRTLMCEAPNVLIVHLQRLLFDFETYRNEKMNQHFEFPSILNLKDYSYHEVMKRENQEPLENEPAPDDCWEYKLVGVNVHSGSADAGHYWSYINTVRGKDEKEDQSWAETDKDQWMEFNDSTVKDYKFENLFGECFGDKQSSQPQVSAWGYEMSSSKYGKSAYMLIYERRLKKPIRIVVADDQEGVYNENTKEYIKLIPYREVVGTETPNQIFSKVLEDNTKFTFENDIYSTEFFNFLKSILENVAVFGETTEDRSELRALGLQVAYKAAFDILARCFYNQGIKDITQIMITILKQDSILLSNFIKSIIANEDALFQVLLECTDSTARNAIGDLFMYLVCYLKMTDFEAASQFIDLMARGLFTIASKHWSRFDKYNEILAAFALYSPEQAFTLSQDRKIDNWTADSEAAQIGLAYFFKTNMLERILDFVLMDKSPMLKVGENRPAMGGSYNGPNFTALMKIITVMSQQNHLLSTYPQSEMCVKMMTHKEILGKIIEAQVKSKSLNSSLTQMCMSNFTMSRKIAKIIFKQVNQNSAEKAIESLKLIKAFLLVDDEYKMQRCEWLLGVPQLVCRNKMYGMELVNVIQDEAHKYPSTLATTMGDISLLNQLLLQIGRQDQFCIKALKAIMSMCLQDSKITEYIYLLPPPTYQHAHYTDWFGSYIKTQKEELDKMNQYSYYLAKIKSATSALKLFEKFETLLTQFQEKEAAQLWEASQQDSFEPLRRGWMFTSNNVLKCYPPQIIIGKQVGSEVVAAQYEDDFVIVQVLHQQHEWAFSNPTGMFNLSLPNKQQRTKNYSTMSYQQYQNLVANEDTETREWNEFATVGSVVLVIQVRSKVSGLLKVEVSVSTSDTNVKLPITPLTQNVFSGDPKVFGVFTKVVPSLEFGEFSLQVKTNGSITNQPVRHSVAISTSTETKTFNCSNCQSLAYDGMEFCEKCGESLQDSSCYDDYFR